MESRKEGARSNTHIFFVFKKDRKNGVGLWRDWCQGLWQWCRFSLQVWVTKVQKMSKHGCNLTWDTERVNQRPFGFLIQCTKFITKEERVTIFRVPCLCEQCLKSKLSSFRCRSWWHLSASRGLVCMFCVCVWRKASRLGSVGADLRDLCVSCLVGRLNEHWLGQFLSCWHRHLLNLIQLL